VVNTCAVTREAVRKSRKLINRIRRESPQGKLVVSGCAVSTGEAGNAADLGIDLLIDNSKKKELVKTVTDALPINIMPAGATIPAESALFARNRQRAFIKIQDEIIDEINQLSAQGIKEIVLTGVHVGGYGSDIQSDLTKLVKEILSSTDMPRIRFASVEPWDLGEHFFTLFENKRLMPHMHLPLQSGCDAILRRMARRCKTAEFTALVDNARKSVENFNVTTDIIVGFPGESDQHWHETLNCVDAIRFGHIHVFSFSPRSGTKAASMDDQIPESIKKQRSAELRQMADEQRREFLQQQLGATATVLWEGRPAVIEPGSRVFGYTENYTRVSASAEHAPAAGGIANCYLASADPTGHHILAEVTQA